MYCKCTNLTKIDVQADFGADPIWCHTCGYNLDIEDFELDEALKTKCFKWINKYGEWLDFDTDEIIEGNLPLLDAHNEEGLFLTKQLQNALPQYHFEFIPS